jgi:hypothetical protein
MATAPQEHLTEPAPQSLATLPTSASDSDVGSPQEILDDRRGVLIWIGVALLLAAFLLADLIAALFR